MGKKKNLTQVDFDFGIASIIPSTQEAFKKEFKGNIRKSESANLAVFKEKLIGDLTIRLKGSMQFPSRSEVFVFIMQYFVSPKEYGSRDIDNMAKTILDVIKGRFYLDDSQVKTLLVGKKLDKRVPENFAYVALKELRSDRDVDALKISGLERSVTLFQELKSQGIL